MTTRIVSIRRATNDRFWIIRDAQGVQYATKNSLVASLADRYRELHTDVRITAGSGWWYRDLDSVTASIEPVEQERAS